MTSPFPITFIKVQPVSSNFASACHLRDDCRGGLATHEIITGVVCHPEDHRKETSSTFRRGCVRCVKMESIEALKMLE
jgi:hypothetical protein